MQPNVQHNSAPMTSRTHKNKEVMKFKLCDFYFVGRSPEAVSVKVKPNGSRLFPAQT